MTRTLLALIAIGFASLHAGEPELTRVSPLAVRPGAATTVKLLGESLNRTVELWTGFPSSVELLSSDSGESVTAEVTVPESVPVGVYAIRLVTREGISNPLLCMVDDLATGATPHDETIRAPIAIDGLCLEARGNRTRIAVAAGQTLSFEVWAMRLGSKLDPVLRILDANARELSFCDDAPGIGDDARVRHTFENAGEYLVEVRHTRFESGADCRYRLRVGDFPLVTTVFPLGARVESDARFRALHEHGGELPEIDVHVNGPTADRRPVSARFADGGPAGAVVFESSDLEEHVESDIVSDTASDTVSSDGALAIPCAINGRFESPGDSDTYAFDVEADRRIEFTAVTRALGSLSFVLLSLLDADGREIARDDPSGADDGRLSHRFEAAGRYALRVEELTGAGGPTHAYRVRIENAAPSVTLSMTDRVFVREGRGFETRVSCERGKFEGAIALEVEGLGDRVIIENAVIAKKQKETKLRVTLPDGAVPAGTRLIRVWARCGKGARRIQVSLRDAWAKRLPRLRFPPAGLEATAVRFLQGG